MGRVFQEAISSQLGALEEEFKLEGRLSQVRSRTKLSLCMTPFRVFLVLEYCTEFGTGPIHRARLTKLGRGRLPVSVLRSLSNSPFAIGQIPTAEPERNSQPS